MGNGKKIWRIIGALIKWICLIAVTVGLIKIFYGILTFSFDKTADLLFNVVICGLTAYAGYRLEKYGKREDASIYFEPEKTPNKTNDKTGKKEPDADSAPEPAYKPVIDRPGIVSNGEFTYEFKIGEDLFAHGEKNLSYPELQWDFQIVANICSHILDNGGVIRSIYIGGGSDEVSHTGAVAYSNRYDSFESFVENCMKDVDRAESDAESEYGSWFSSLDYKYIIIAAKIKETDIKAEYSNMGFRIRVSISLGKGSEGFPYLMDLVRKFGVAGYDQGVGADKVFWDSSLKIFRRTYQLEESRTYFLSSYMNTEGDFTKYSLDVETADDSHYEILPKKMEKLTQILKEEMNQKYLRNPAKSCADYLQHHSGGDLIALLKKHHLIDKEFHY